MIAEATKPRAYGYIRVSRSFQAKGTSLAEQTEAISRYFAYTFHGQDVKWSGWFSDKCSGQTPMANRPQGAKITETLRGGDHIIIAKLDRGFRNGRDALTQVDAWDKLGITVHLLDVPGMGTGCVGRLLFGILAMVAEFETNRRRERVAENQAYAYSRGLAYNNPKFLWKRVRGPNGLDIFVIDEHHRAIAQKIVEWRHAGWSLKSITEHLAKEGVLTSARAPYKPRPWSFSIVYTAYQQEMWLRKKAEENGGVLPEGIMPPEGKEFTRSIPARFFDRLPKNGQGRNAPGWKERAKQKKKERAKQLERIRRKREEQMQERLRREREKERREQRKQEIRNGLANGNGQVNLPPPGPDVPPQAGPEAQ